MGNQNSKKYLQSIVIRWETRQVEIEQLLYYIKHHKNPTKTQILKKLQKLQTNMIGDTNMAKSALDDVHCPSWKQ